MKLALSNAEGHITERISVSSTLEKLIRFSPANKGASLIIKAGCQPRQQQTTDALKQLQNRDFHSNNYLFSWESE